MKRFSRICRPPGHGIRASRTLDERCLRILSWIPGTRATCHGGTSQGDDVETLSAPCCPFEDWGSHIRKVRDCYTIPTTVEVVKDALAALSLEISIAGSSSQVLDDDSFDVESHTLMGRTFGIFLFYTEGTATFTYSGLGSDAGGDAETLYPD